MSCTLLRRVQRASSVNSAAQSTNCGARFRKKDQWIATSPHSFDCIQACYTNQTVANSVYMKFSIASEVLWPSSPVLHKAATWSLKHKDFVKFSEMFGLSELLIGERELPVRCIMFHVSFHDCWWLEALGQVIKVICWVPSVRLQHLSKGRSNQRSQAYQNGLHMV